MKLPKMAARPLPFDEINFLVIDLMEKDIFGVRMTPTSRAATGT